MKFVQFLGQRADEPIGEITKQDVVAFRHSLVGQVTAKTVNHDLKALKMLFKSARRDSAIADDPTEFIEAVRKERGMALQEAKIRVPQDVSVIGYDDMPEAAFAIPPLTTVNQDYEGIGTTAVNNLIAASRKEKFSPNILLRSPFVVRASTGPVREG
jgi:hypothetical protein